MEYDTSIEELSADDYTKLISTRGTAPSVAWDFAMMAARNVDGVDPGIDITIGEASFTVVDGRGKKWTVTIDEVTN